MELQRHYSDFRQLGAEMYAISVDAPVGSKVFVNNNGLEFPVLSDQSRETIMAYGVHDRLLDIAKPSTFIIDRSGEIRWKFIGDTTHRTNIDNIIQELESLKSLSFSVPAGTSLVHFPFTVRGVNGAARAITKVSDLFDILGGETNVNWLITTPAPTREGYPRFRAFFTASDTAAQIPSNTAIQPDTGILASLKATVTMELSGSPVEGELRLYPGPNLVGIPHKNAGIRRVSDFAQFPNFLDKISLISIYVNGTFHPILPDDIASGALNDFEILPGQAFVVVAKENWFQRF